MKYVATVLAILGFLSLVSPASAYWTTDFAAEQRAHAARRGDWHQTPHYAKAQQQRFVGHSSGNVHSKAGASASVSPQYASAFQALVDDLEAHGAVIRFMGGYRPGRCGQANKHACGMALDVCQYARDVVEGKCNLPGREAENKIAATHGLFHGGAWCTGDRGHFEAGGSVACGQNWATLNRKPRPRTLAGYGYRS